MKRRDSIIISAQNYYGRCHNLNSFLEKKDGDEIFYDWSDHLSDISRGFVYLLKCQPGLALTIARHYPATAFSIPFEGETNYVNLFFILSEGSQIQHHSQEQKTIFCSNQGYLTFARNRMSGLVHCPAKPFCTIGILMEPWFIKRFSQGIAGEFARKIKGILAIQKQGDFFCCPVLMTRSINICMHEILGCTYIDARRHLFLGSKALELMIFGFDQFNPDNGQGISCFNLTDSMHFVHKARDIIISDIKNPPSLTELSRMVGVNRTTLSQNFREVYGVTIFDFLRTFRMEESKRLLRTGNRSVTQIAFEVGYSQQKTFSKEFKKYFGDTPSAYLGPKQS
jgi:AraC-like DNA-binding protein